MRALCIGLGFVNFGLFSLNFSKLTLVAEFLVMAVVLITRRLVANSTATKTSMPSTSVYGAECIKSGRAAVISKTTTANSFKPGLGGRKGGSGSAIPTASIHARRPRRWVTIR